jgi:hypothetical protein
VSKFTFVKVLLAIEVTEPAYALNAGAAVDAKVIVAPVIVGLVSVLLVRVSVVVLPTNVSVVVGNVSVVVPDTAGEDNVTLPDVEPLSIRLAISYCPLDI